MKSDTEKNDARFEAYLREFRCAWGAQRLRQIPAPAHVKRSASQRLLPWAMATAAALAVGLVVTSAAPEVLPPALPVAPRASRPQTVAEAVRYSTLLADLRRGDDALQEALDRANPRILVGGGQSEASLAELRQRLESRDNF